MNSEAIGAAFENAPAETRAPAPVPALKARGAEEVGNGPGEGAARAVPVAVRLPAPERLTLTARELAGILGIGLRTVWALVRNGELPRPLRLGGRSLWLVSGVLTRLEERQRAAEGEARRAGRRS